eukprot:5256168-Amphidinium_carterae.1
MQRKSSRQCVPTANAKTNDTGLANLRELCAKLRYTCVLRGVRSAATIGACLLALIYSLAPVSGAALNPAVCASAVSIRR